MSVVRKILFKVLGVKKYLAFISKIYIRRVEKGKYQEKYPELHFLKHFIQPHFYCIDIGANLGYYSYFLSKYAHQGKVWGVEPVPIFAEILKKNCSSLNFTHVPYALGGENTIITMTTPMVNGVFRHGLTKISTDKDSENSSHTYQVEMKIPDELFHDFPHLDFVKCDVEGYEYIIFQNFMKVIQRHLPILQIEIQPHLRENMYTLLQPLGYVPHKLENQAWVTLSYENYLSLMQDIYFLPSATIH
jgi:FkbM family methyltransferase